MPITFSHFAQALEVETAFSVLAVARRLQGSGKDVVELEIGDSPFPTTAQAAQAGVAAIAEQQTKYGPSLGLPEFRQAAADFVQREFDIPASAENVAAGPGAKIFEQFFCEAFLNPGDGVLIFNPWFPTYGPNIERRAARAVYRPLRQVDNFRPRISDVEDFLNTDEAPRAIFLNSPHNPTGGVTTSQDLHDLADLIRGRDIIVFSDEPYCHMIWQGRHHSLAALPSMLDQCVATYTFSKSWSMSGWRLGFCVSSVDITEMIGRMINTSLSCIPPFVQHAGIAAMRSDTEERDTSMNHFGNKVRLITDGLNQLDGFHALPPAATFYVFPNVAPVCNRLGITSHGLAMYLLEGADDAFGIACLGGECFGSAGAGFLRFSCAEPDDRLRQAIAFIPQALSRQNRITAWLETHPEFRQNDHYDEP